LGPSRVHDETFEGNIEMGINWVHTQSEPLDFTNAVAAGDSRVGVDLVANCLVAAAQGDLSAYFDLGVAFSTGSHGAECDLIEAHKWFNLAAVAGHEDAQMCRAEISEEMTAREIAEAQRRAREWIAATRRHAA
jgi:TPR repeat protein